MDRQTVQNEKYINLCCVIFVYCTIIIFIKKSAAAVQKAANLT